MSLKKPEKPAKSATGKMSEADESATKIQAAYRGYRERKQVLHYLFSILFSISILYFLS